MNITRSVQADENSVMRSDQNAHNVFVQEEIAQDMTENLEVCFLSTRMRMLAQLFHVSEAEHDFREFLLNPSTKLETKGDGHLHRLHAKLEDELFHLNHHQRRVYENQTAFQILFRFLSKSKRLQPLLLGT